MGLPYWTAPAPIDVKTAKKVDVSSAQRSPIRRRGGSRTPALLQRTTRRAGGTRDELSNASGRSAPGPAAPWPIPPHPRRSEEYSSRAQGSWTNLPPLPTPSWDYSQAPQDLSRAPSYHAAASYRYVAGLERDNDGYLPARNEPQRRTAGRDTPDDGSRHRALRSLSMDGPRLDGRLDHELRQLAPLRRSGRRNVADGPLPASSLRESWEPASSGSTPNPSDGLGDRERSISPAAENDGADAWDTMLTTITPDVQLPSFDSFTSAAASASFSGDRSYNNSQSRFDSDTRSSSTSAASSATHLTVPSPTLAPLTTTEPECTTDNEHSLDSGSDTDEDDPEMIAASEYLARIRHPHSPPRRSLTRSTGEMREALRNRPSRTSAIRDDAEYRAEAALRGAMGIQMPLNRAANHRPALHRPGFRQESLVSDITRLQEHSRELDRQMDELRNISADIDGRHFERGREQELQQRHPRDRDAESERRPGLTPLSHYATQRDRERDSDVSRFISHFETFRAARDAAQHALPAELGHPARGEAGGPPLSTSPPLRGETSNDGFTNNNYGNDDDPTLSRDEMLGNDPELEGMRSILERLSQRLDIPSSWWRSAGLSTTGIIPRGRL